MKNYLFVFLFISYSLGILFQEYLNWYWILAFFLCQLIVNYFCLRDKITAIFPNLMLILFVILGFYTQFNSKEKLGMNGYNVENQIYKLKVNQQIGTSDKYAKYKVDVLHPRLEEYNKILLYLPKSDQQLYPDDEIIINGNFTALPKTLNPYQFDYGQFLKRRGISGQIFAKEMVEYQVGSGIFHDAAKSKINILTRMKSNDFSEDAIGIVGAMLLGTYSELNQETYQAYVNTGVVHILSISGLHVMMIFSILMFVTLPLKNMNNGRQIQIVLCLIVIWIYAFYVELKPPVFRSSLMISIYYLSILLHRKPNIYHTLALSGLIILMYNPNFLFDVGFQLSFSAVFFIVWLNPIFIVWIWKGNKIWQYIKGLTATSISAQFGTMPFATFYFNQFSWLFLLGNLVLIPASFVMMVLGIIVIFLVLIGHVPDFIVWIYNHFIEWTNVYIATISGWDDAIWRNLYISPFTAILLIISLFAIRIAIQHKSKVALLVLIVSLTMNFVHRRVDMHQKKQISEMIIFNQYKQSLIAIKSKNELYVFSSNVEDSVKWKQFVIQPYANHQRVSEILIYDINAIVNHPEFEKSSTFIHWKNTLIYLGEEMNLDTLDVDYYLLRNSKLRYRDVEKIQTKRIIADGSNYPRYVDRMDSILNLNHRDTVWNTAQDGYFRLDF